jgi:hypothetical protein
MIQFNLLPDVKLQYIRARYRQRIVVAISLVTTGVCLAIFILLILFVRVAQTKELSDLSKDITTSKNKLEGTKDLDKVLTIQNQLNSITGLHDQKVISSRLLDYLTKLTPLQATISDVDSDFTVGVNKMTIKGNADALSTVNKYADTLKFTVYPKTVDNKSTEVKAFSNVTLKSFSIGTATSVASASKGIGYELSFNFDPDIFANTKDADPPELIVPKIITTRSETEKPAVLFVPQPKSTDTE